jgi:hypothetical protein
MMHERNSIQRIDANIGLIKIVNAHLNQLSAQSVFNADEASLRVASGSLRFLLVDDMLVRAWRASDERGPMRFKTWGIASTHGDDVIAYCGGGDNLPGMPTSMCRNATLKELWLDLKDFWQRPRIQIGTVKVSTVELVQFVANTLGATHFDPEGKSLKSRKPVFNLLRDVEAGRIGNLGMLVNNRNLLHHEVLSIAQAVIRSPEVAQLRACTASNS